MPDRNFRVKNALELGTGTITVGANTVTLPSSTDTLVGRTTSDTLTNKILQSPEEIVTISATAATGTINFDLVTQSVMYYTTNSSANWTLNLRGNLSTSLNSILPVGAAITCAFLVTNGSTPYYQTGFQIDGSSGSVTLEWQGGSAPTAGNASGIDVYSFTIIKTAATPTYIALGSLTGFA